MAREKEAFITYTKTGKLIDEEVWATYIGTKKEIEWSAQGLLEELREENPRAKVWIDGKQIRKSKTKEQR